MKYWKSILYLWFVVWILGCTSDPYEAIPVIKIVDDGNKQFTFTNKVAGFYVGNSHRVNSNRDYGWTVNEFHFLKDYRVYTNNSLLERDSLTIFKYYPFAFERSYRTTIKETFTLLDSVNAIIWEFDLPADLADFTFEPLLHHKISGKNIKLGTSLSQVIFSPRELSSDGITMGADWMGFLYLNGGKNNIIVIGVIETSQNRLSSMLKHLTEKFDIRKNKRINRIASILNNNNTHTNITEITEAISWAHLSIDALITEQRGKGIWAGLPWFNNYWGRDSFISFPGALLIPGKFNEAKEILESFSRFQLQNESDTWDGRIPNRVTNDEIIYNNADGTWWFVRELYEYLLYSGDIGFVHQIYPVVKRAIKGAIRHRIDENFFLLHDDSDTWMDAIGPEGARSPRGNRAIEIQTLWYTALQIGSIFADLNQESQLKEHWLAISHNLRENINKKFWSRVKNRVYDHLNENGFPDRKIRPNQIFAVYVPGLPGVEPLFPDEKCARITSNVVHKLTYRYGVASLWQEDEDFHPWHLNPQNYHKDEAYHNGTVWSWLAGPVISSMLMFNRHELAFNLYYDEAIQILQDDAIGNFAELRDALPRKDQEESAISGTISQAWSLAEFTRNFYQDFIGYRPNALKNRITISPKIPAELGFISTKLPYVENFISFTYTADEGTYNFEFSLIGENGSVEMILKYPGFDPVHFHLTDDDPSYSISLNSKAQRSYFTYTELEWYFAQPELREGFAGKIESAGAAR